MTTELEVWVFGFATSLEDWLSLYWMSTVLLNLFTIRLRLGSNT